MPVLKGSVSGSISTISYNIPCKVLSGFFVNKSSGAVILNIYVASGSGSDRQIIPLNTTLISGTMYVFQDVFKMAADDYFIITTNANLEYYITVE